MLLSRALPLADGIVEALRAHPAAERVELAGSARRLADSVKDLDIVATAADPPALLAAFAELDVIESVVLAGRERRPRAHPHAAWPSTCASSSPTSSATSCSTSPAPRRTTWRCARPRCAAACTSPSTAILDDATGETHRCATEEEVYALLGLPWIPPELREDRGELALRDASEVPRLIEQADLRGDLHMHTVASDGRNTIEEMARGARERGYEYIAITDHSATHGFGNHVDARRAAPPDRARARGRTRELDGIEVLIGTETNILPDGSPDYDDDLLAELDWVVGSVHTSFGDGRGAR